MSEADKARLAALEKQAADLAAENAALKKSNVEFAEAQASAKKAGVHTANVEFAEGLVKAGKLLPAAKETTVALMDNLAAQEAKIEFGEGDGKQSLAPLAVYKAQLEAMPKQVEFGEVAGAVNGNAVDLDNPTELAKKIVDFREAEEKAGRIVSVTDALNHIKKGSA